MAPTAPITAPHPLPPPAQSISLRRRTSIATSVIIPSKLPHFASSPPSLDLQVIPFSKYTSIKELLPSPAAAVNSPKDLAPAAEISIRNRLVKHAAYAYLQPMSSSQEYPDHHFLRRLCLRLSGEQNSDTTCLIFIRCKIFPFVAQAVNRLIQLFGS